MARLENIPLSTLKHLEAAVRHESFEKAAAELHVTGSAVSQQILKLEARLGITLFTRLTKRVEPTEPARILAAPLSDAFQMINNALNVVSQMAATGPIKLMIYQTWATRWLIPRLPALAEAWPDLSVEFETGMAHVDFVRSDIDFAIRSERVPHSRIKRTKLFDQILSPVCAPSLAGRLRSIQDLASVPLIVSQNRSSDWKTWLSAIDHKLLDITPKLIFSNSTLAYEAAIAGSGVALGQSHLLTNEIASGLLVAPFDVGVDIGEALYLLEPEHRSLRPAARAFREWIIAEAARSSSVPAWISTVYRASHHAQSHHAF